MSDRYIMKVLTMLYYTELPSVGLPGCSFPNLSNSSGVGSVSLANLAATNPLGKLLRTDNSHRSYL